MMEGKSKPKQGWVGFPESTEEQIEDEAVKLIAKVMKWKKKYDRPGAQWRVGTTKDVDTRLKALPLGYVALGVSSWHDGSPMRAAKEIVEYHRMELEGNLHETDTEIYVYTDRPPTIYELREREKDPLTRKQKAVHRAIKSYFDRNGRGPSTIEVKRMLGHRSITTTRGFLDILEQKNWIVVPERRQPIELI